jgi:hypothetical protein
MSCMLALSAALALADSYALPPQDRPQPPAAVSPLAAEPLYADIIGRARALKGDVLALEALPGLKVSPTALGADRIAGWTPRAEALAALDMKGHYDLAARKRDGDLKCILKGVSEDLPRKLAEVKAAKTGADEYSALEELAYLLDDNVGVLTAPPKPPA